MTKRGAESSATNGSTHQLDLLGGSESESERARELAVADQKPRRSNAELEQLQRATAESLGALDQHTQGRLRELVERAGDELAALIDLVLNNREAST
jgi:hypothetical protein